MRFAVVNASAPHYNLGALKLAAWRRAVGDEVTELDGDPGMFVLGFDTVAISVVFSWHAPIAAEVARRVSGMSDVWCGGPGMFALWSWWTKTTGLQCHRGLDDRFERQPGNYRMVFASRGCPVNCSFCIVPRLEGLTFKLNWWFQPAPILCDNNISALPVEFQEHVIRRYEDRGVKLIDANSGFEPLTFDQGTRDRWAPVIQGPWRFAFDTTSEESQVRRMMTLLKDVSPRKKRVYVLIGNEPFAECYERAQKVIEWGGEPHVQPMMPLNALSRNDYKIAHDWTETRLRDFARYYNGHVWRSAPLSEYKPRVNEAPPFAIMGKRSG